MATITATELCSAGTFVQLAHASQNNLGNQTWMVYAKLSAVSSGGSGYFFGKTPTGATGGPRGAVLTAGGTFVGKSSTGTAGSPYRQSNAGAVSFGSWHHIAFLIPGSLASSVCVTYVDGSTPSSLDWGEGLTGGIDDSANPVYLLNRYGLGRELIGSVAYIARWNKQLNGTEMANVLANGPLAEPTGLILCWANNQDYGPNSLTPVSRSTFSAGDLPPNLALGGAADPNGSVTGGTGTGTGSGSGGNATGVAAGNGVVTSGTGTGTGSGIGGDATGIKHGIVTGGTGTGTGSGSGGNATGVIATGSITVGPLENSPGSLWLSQSVAWTWSPLGRVGSMESVTVVDGTGTTHATTGVLTVIGLAFGDGELRVAKLGATAVDDLHYVEYGTVA